MSGARKTRKDTLKGTEEQLQRDVEASHEDADVTNDINKRLSKIEDMISDLKVSLHKKYGEIEDRLSDLTKSQKFICEQYDSFRKVVDALMIDNGKLRDENAQLKVSIHDLQEDVKQAHEAVNNLEQYGRRAMLEISGIPRCEEEDVEEIVLAVCNKIGVDLQPSEIETAHRLSNKESANIIALLSSRKRRNEIFQRRSNLKGVTTRDIGITTRASSKIYVNESLTRKNKALFNKVLDFKKENGYKYIWTRNGNIYIRQADHTRSIVIKEAEDLHNLPT